MLQYDLSHQAAVMTAVNDFVDYQLHDGFNQTDFHKAQFYSLADFQTQHAGFHR